MKRAEGRGWPKEIIEVPPETSDPRSRDSYATQKISRAELEEALKRTKSGTRRAVRSDPSFEQTFDDKIEETNESNVEPVSGPHDDTPQVTIVQIESAQIESVELDAVDRVTVASMQVPPPAMPVVTTPQPVEPVLRPMTPAYDFADDAPRTSTERAITHRSQARRWQLSPRTAFILGLALVLFVTLAAGAGFLAGRGMLHLPH